MAARGYTDSDRVASFLGRQFTAEQKAAADLLVEAVEATIDTRCGRAWLVGTRANEAHWGPFGRLVRVHHPPCISISAVLGRACPGAPETALVADTDYEIRDLEAGSIWLAAPWRYDRLRITYATSTTVPADIELAATEILAAFLHPVLHEDSHGIESYRLPDLEVKYSRWVETKGLPPAAEERLERHVFRVVA